ncbi:hypothetical protein PMIN04_005399 [Paraphaeosphaeria minitans]
MLFQGYVSLCFGTLSPGVLVSACADDDDFPRTRTIIAIIAISISFCTWNILSICCWLCDCRQSIFGPVVFYSCRRRRRLLLLRVGIELLAPTPTPTPEGAT